MCIQILTRGKAGKQFHTLEFHGLYNQNSKLIIVLIKIPTSHMIFFFFEKTFSYGSIYTINLP